MPPSTHSLYQNSYPPHTVFWKVSRLIHLAVCLHFPLIAVAVVPCLHLPVTAFRQVFFAVAVSQPFCTQQGEWAFFKYINQVLCPSLSFSGLTLPLCQVAASLILLFYSLPTFPGSPLSDTEVSFSFFEYHIPSPGLLLICSPTNSFSSFVSA